ncbi:type II toxin-antitoxin system HigB family toxin [bacterium]|nr:type II toxin-antitoxin system HigB family toxin [bacterium]
MRIIARKTLREFWLRHRQAEQPLKSWFQFVSAASWSSPNNVKCVYHNASFLEDNRVCFNISGNKYRLIVKINYSYKIVYIRFIGTHKDYDLIDANTI